MTDMLDKCAKALAEELYGDDDEWRKCVREAAAVIRALMEPTPEMVSAGAYELTSSFNNMCCSRTGGKGRTDGKECECRNDFVDSFTAALRSILPKETP